MVPGGNTIGIPTFAPLRDFWFRFRALFLPSSTSLLSPAADFLMAGGVSIVFFFVLNYLVTDTSSFNTWAIAIYYAAFLVNYPHFTSSYQLLYQDGSKGFFAFSSDKILSLKLWWAGFIVPAILIGYFLFALSTENSVLMGYLAAAMYFFVGWHYVKQIYGCMIVLSSAKKVYYNFAERWSTLATLYSLWAVSFMAANQNGGSNIFYQITYPIGNISATSLYVAVGFMGAALFTMFALFTYKYIRDRQHPPLSALAAFVSIFLWFFPFYIWFEGLSSQYFFYVVPFFHSLQYLLFVLAYKRNWSLKESIAAQEPSLLADKIARPLARITFAGVMLFMFIPAAVVAAIMWYKEVISIETFFTKSFSNISAVSPELWNSIFVFLAVLVAVMVLVWMWSRRNVYGKFARFFVNAYVLGLFLFALIPNMLDVLSHNAMLPDWLTYDTKLFGTALYLYFFTLFINIHHYFIDNVIWRRDNSHIREYIFTR